MVVTIQTRPPPRVAVPPFSIVFYEALEYEDGSYIAEHVAPSDTALVHLCRAKSSENLNKTYAVAGITITPGTEGCVTVDHSGSVPFCNTGYSPISASMEIWARMLEDAPAETIGRTSSDTVKSLLDSGYHYIGMCLKGADASDVEHGRFCYGQVLLSLHGSPVGGAITML